MRIANGLYGVVLLGAGLSSFVGCGKNEDGRPPPLQETGGTAGEGATDSGGRTGGTSGAGADSGGATETGGASGGEGATPGIAGADSGGGIDAGGAEPGGAGTAGAGTGATGTGATGTGATGTGATGTGAVGTGANGGAEAGGTAGSPTGGAPAGGTGGGIPNGGASGSAGAGGTIQLPDGDPCTEYDQCPGGQFCYQGVTSIGSCRRYCDPSDVGTDVGCNAGELCILAVYSSGAGCLQRCTPFLTPSGCPDTEWCMPNPSVTYTDGVAVDGLCVEAAAGTTEGGESCEGGAACGGGLMCYWAGDSVFGFDTCEPTCDPAAAPDTIGACPTGAVCRTPPSSSTSACVTLCDPFGAATCAGGDHCVAFRDYVDDNLNIAVEGHCVKSGPKNRGEICQDGECGAGLDCIEEPLPYGSASTCRSTCETEATNACGTSDTCVPVGTGTSGVGTCELGCTIFAEGVDAGCEASKWCAPTFLGGDEGGCTVPGPVALGDSCDRASDCATGAYCECRFGRREGCSAAVCDKACRPGAGSGDPDACGGGETCVRLFEPRGLQPAPFGVCRPTCDADGAATCPDTAETCVAGALLADGVDACIDVPDTVSVGEYCIANDVDEGEPCGRTDVCALLPGESLDICIDACRFSEGGIGTTNHPDCADPAASCDELAPGLDYGQCVAP